MDCSFFLPLEGPGHHCTQRDIENLGEVMIMQVFQVFRHDHSAIFWRKFCQGCCRPWKSLQIHRCVGKADSSWAKRPVLFILAHNAHSTVLSRSASSSTMKASLPPSSIVDFLRFWFGGAWLRPLLMLLWGLASEEGVIASLSNSHLFDSAL
jgi:hypothetical protein